METEVQPAPDTGAGNDDVRADVIAAFRQHSAAPETPAPETEPEPAAASEVDAPGRPRNERGQFIRADGTVDTEAEAARVPDADPGPDKLEQPSTAVEPPKSWSADVKAEWSKLPPAVQQAVIKRENEINEGGRRWSEERRQYDEVLTPVRGLAQQHGVDEREAINRLLAANEWLERDPQGAIAAFAQAYGVDLSAPSNNNAPPTDPLVARLHQEVSGLKSTLQQRERDEASSAIQSFASSPGHEHFEAVKARMGQLMEAGQANDLNDAYEKAIWLDPSIRPQLIAAQTASELAARRAAEKATADKARAGALSLSGSPAGGPAPQAPAEYETVRDAVKAAFRQHAAR